MIAKSMQPLLEGSSLIRAVFEEGRKLSKKYGDEKVFDFSVGNPGLYPPQEVFDAIDYINHEMDAHQVHGYSPNAGFDSTRKAVADDLNRRFGDNFTYNHIIMTVGASAAINDIFKCIYDPGDKLIVFAPYFLEYKSWALNAGVETVVVPPDETNNFEPDAEAMKALLCPEVKAVMINNPNNPTGAIYSRESLQAVCDVLKEAEKEFGHPIYIIVDEPYRELNYTDKEIPYIPAMYDNCFIAYSYSKSLSLPGDRIGYVAVSPRQDNPEEMIDALIVANRITGGTSAPTLAQLIVERSINARVDVPYYKKNAEDLYRIVTEAGFTAIVPQGAFYLWIKSPIESEHEFVAEAKKEMILIVPGDAFAGPGWVRASFCIENSRIQNSAENWKRLGEKYFG